jgi:hypothetical protein
VDGRKTKLNCWEFKKCGRQPGGAHVRDLGICPVTQEARLDGVHGGSYAGRACWVIAGSLCDGELQGTFAEKFRNCEQCDFYQAVRDEEYPNFTLSGVLLNKIRQPLANTEY